MLVVVLLLLTGMWQVAYNADRDPRETLAPLLHPTMQYFYHQRLLCSHRSILAASAKVTPMLCTHTCFPLTNNTYLDAMHRVIISNHAKARGGVGGRSGGVVLDGDAPLPIRLARTPLPIYHTTVHGVGWPILHSKQGRK